MVLAPSSGLGGGIERYIAEVERALRAREAHVVRIDLYRPGHGRLLSKLRFLLLAVLAMATSRPSHVFVMHRDLFAVSGWLAALVGATSIGWVYGAEVFWPPGCLRTVRLARHLDLVATISDFTAARLISALPLLDHVPIIRPALGPGWWRLVKAISPPPAARPRLVAVSRLDESADGKGVWTVVQLAAELRKQFPDLECRIIGGGSQLDAYRRRLRAGGHQPYCQMLGPVPDSALVRELKQASLFLLPSRAQPPDSGEGFGIAYVEAASVGLPVVGSTDAGAREAVADGISGLVVDPRDTAALVEACRRLLADPGLRVRMGTAGSSWSRHSFGPERFDSDIDGLLARLPNRRRLWQRRHFPWPDGAACSVQPPPASRTPPAKGRHPLDPLPSQRHVVSLSE